MTRIRLLFGKDGVLLSCNAEGHAGFARRGSDIVCAAVTCLVRTTLDVLSNSADISLKSEAPSRGKLAFCVEGFDSSQRGRLIYAGQFLLKGLESIQREYPQYIELRQETVNN